MRKLTSDELEILRRNGLPVDHEYYQGLLVPELGEFTIEHIIRNHTSNLYHAFEFPRSDLPIIGDDLASIDPEGLKDD